MPIWFEFKPLSHSHQVCVVKLSLCRTVTKNLLWSLSICHTAYCLHNCLVLLCLCDTEVSQGGVFRPIIVTLVSLSRFPPFCDSSSVWISNYRCNGFFTVFACQVFLTGNHVLSLMQIILYILIYSTLWIGQESLMM